MKLVWWRKLRQGGLFTEGAPGWLGRSGRSMQVRRRGGWLSWWRAAPNTGVALRIWISRSLRARVRVRKTRGGYCAALRQKMPCLPHLKQTRDGPHPPECCAGCCDWCRGWYLWYCRCGPCCWYYWCRCWYCCWCAGCCARWCRGWYCCRCVWSARCCSRWCRGWCCGYRWFGGRPLPSRLPRPPPLWLPRPPLHPPLLALKPAARAWLPSVPSELLHANETTLQFG